MHVVAPPAVRFRPDEPDSQRVSWRHVVWFLRDHDDEPVVSADLPDEVLTMRTVEVVELLSEQHHEFVRLAMARQIRRAALMEHSSEGACLADRHAQLAGRARGWVTHELIEAFPEESWFKSSPYLAEIPATVDELLQRIPSAEAAPLPERSWRTRLATWIQGRPAEEPVALPRGREFCSGHFKKRLIIAFWAAEAVGRLPYADGASDRLVARVTRWSERLD